MQSLLLQKKRFSITFSKGKTEFCLSLSNRDNSYLFVNGKNSLSLKLIMETFTFQVRFVQEICSCENGKYVESFIDDSVIM